MFRMIGRFLIMAFLCLFASFAFGEAQEEPDGAAVYTKFGCGSCHASHQGGTDRAPSLRSVGNYWDEKTLANYLKDPVTARDKDERLHKLSEKYAPVRMLPFDFREPELKALVQFLLRNRKPGTQTQTQTSQTQ